MHCVEHTSPGLKATPSKGGYAPSLAMKKAVASHSVFPFGGGQGEVAA